MRPYFVGNTTMTGPAGVNMDMRCSTEYDNCAKRRFRTNFTEGQSLVLEEAFQESHYPDQNAKRAMSVLLDIPEDRITVWFQNRRAKWRRKEMRDREKKTADYGLSGNVQRTTQLSLGERHFEQFPQSAHMPSMEPFTSAPMQSSYVNVDNNFMYQTHY
uniref:Homeobox domain-containing protein n=1 Tax=Steinernema glaseri TaxID=37863 RepID=A0A1I8ARC2_9BILA